VLGKFCRAVGFFVLWVLLHVLLGFVEFWWVLVGLLDLFDLLCLLGCCVCSYFEDLERGKGGQDNKKY
jgi:hypothetical protein